MDAVIKAVVGSLVTLGPAGVIMGAVIAALGYWAWKQQQQLNAVQERRVEDAMKTVAAVYTFANALDRNTEALRAFASEE